MKDKEESLLPSVESIYSEILEIIEAYTAQESVKCAKAITKLFVKKAELIVDITLDVASNKAKVIYDTERSDDLGRSQYKVQKHSILSLKTDPKLKVS